MKSILCYGDSNTYGYNPSTKLRYNGEERWTGILGKQLGPGFHVIEEGLNGRTTVWDDPIEEYKSGKNYLIPCLESHAPIDLVILWLGTNDLKKRFSLSAHDISLGVSTLITMIQKSNTGIEGLSPDILLLSPTPLGVLDEYAQMFEGGKEKSEKLTEYYSKLANEFKCEFINTSEYISTSLSDGLHFDKEDHKILGQTIADKVQQLFI